MGIFYASIYFTESKTQMYKSLKKLRDTSENLRKIRKDLPNLKNRCKVMVSYLYISIEFP